MFLNLFVIQINKTGYFQHINNILNRIEICLFSSSSSSKKL